MTDAKSFFNPELCCNETEVESKFIVHYLLPALGYTPGDWGQEVTLGNFRLDFLAIAYTFFPIKHKFRLVIEVKGPNAALDPHVRKLRQYQTRFQARYGLLTNGKKIRVYEWSEPDFKLVKEFAGVDIEKHIGELRQLIGKDAKPKLSNPIKKIRKHKMKTIAIYHNKGGVGKTTVSVNLAAALSLKGYRVLLIDLDSQANSTFATGLVKFQFEEDDDLKDSNVYHILESGDFYPISEIARTSNGFNKPEIRVIPAHISLIDGQYKLSAVDASETRLITKLKKEQDNYDFVIIDTPPSRDLYAKVAMKAADYLIIPSDLKPFANQGLSSVKSFIKEIDEFRDIIGKKPLQLLGVLPSKVSANSKALQYTFPRQKEAVINRYQLPVMESIIFERTPLSSSFNNTVTVGDFEIPDPKSIFTFNHKDAGQSADDFEALATEVLHKVGVK